MKVLRGLLLAVALFAVVGSGWYVHDAQAGQRAILVVGDKENVRAARLELDLRERLIEMRKQGAFRGLSQSLKAYNFSVGVQRRECERLHLSRASVPYICIVELGSDGVPKAVVAGMGVPVTSVDQAVAALSGWLGLRLAGQRPPVAVETPVAVRTPEGVVTPGESGTWEDFVKKFPRRSSAAPMEMVQVRGGTFTMGVDYISGDEKPPHPVTVATFYLGKCEVTNARYREFVKATGYHVSDSWESYAEQWGDNAPVVNVSWTDAMCYCYWAGYRLPTEAEWEYAARGSEGRKYPWGNDWDAERAVHSGNSGSRAQPVGSRPSGASWCGCLDLAGNVWEWCSTAHHPYPYSASDEREDGSGIEKRVCRGGSWSYGGENVCCGAYRCYVAPVGRLNLIGFRVARTP